MNAIHAYVSTWGTFQIPSGFVLEVVDQAPQSFFGRLFRRPHEPVLDIAKLPRNPDFWRWLNEQEVAAGKPT